LTDSIEIKKLNIYLYITENSTKRSSNTFVTDNLYNTSTTLILRETISIGSNLKETTCKWNCETYLSKFYNSYHFLEKGTQLLLAHTPRGFWLTTLTRHQTHLTPPELRGVLNQIE